MSVKFPHMFARNIYKFKLQLLHENDAATLNFESIITAFRILKKILSSSLALYSQMLHTCYRSKRKLNIRSINVHPS